jgi:outer membrane protein TolC
VQAELRLRSVLLIGLVLPIVAAPAKAASADAGIMPQTAPASISAPVALSAVFDESLVNSPRVASIRAQLGIAKAARQQALILPNPSFFFLQDTAQLARQIGASIPIEPPWKLVFRLLVAKNQIKQADLEIARSLWQFRGIVRRAYLDVVMSNEATETFAELRSLAGEIKTVAQKRFDASDVAALDVYRADLAAMQAEADYKQSAKKVLQTKQRLSVILGRGYTEVIEVLRLPQFQLRAATNELLPDFSQPMPPLSGLVDKALQTRLDIKVVQQSIVVNDSSIRLSKANRLPDPVVNVGDSYSGNPPRPSTATRGFYIGVTEEVPILNRNQGEIARLKAIKAQLGIELNSTKNQATEEVVSAYQQLAAARERVELFQTQILPASSRVARMARRAYEVGQNDINSTLAAQQANVQTKNAYLEAVRNYQQSLTDLEQAVGQPF